jgi:acetyl/propionyl-CoA carboxylase alpha subunit
MRYRFQWRQQVYNISIERHSDGYLAQVEGLPYEFNILDVQPGQLSLLFEGQPVTLYWAEQGGKRWISLDGCTYLLEKPTLRGRRATEGESEGSMRAPMPAQVRDIHVAEGMLVEKGETLLLLEAMKMEIRVQAPKAGRVARIAVQVGQSVNRDQELAFIENLQETQSEAGPSEL